MRLWVGITDYDWYHFLADLSPFDEVNFWQPSGNVAFRALAPGELFLFKLHAPRNFIVGGGVFAHWSALPVSLAWEAFGNKNGAASLEEMRLRLARYRRVAANLREDYDVGCILLEQPFFLPESEWIPAPRDWKGPIQRGRGYDATAGEGQFLWRELTDRVPAAAAAAALPSHPFEPQAVYETRSTRPTLVYPRLGQGTFRILITDLYSRRCAVTNERTLPVLQASHIRPIEKGGPHDPRNGLLFRSDVHTLFDRGYLTVSEDLHLEVGRRIREEFENGRDYYALHGRRLAKPALSSFAPSSDYLAWHRDHVFRG